MINNYSIPSHYIQKFLYTFSQIQIIQQNTYSQFYTHPFPIDSLNPNNLHDCTITFQKFTQKVSNISKHQQNIDFLQLGGQFKKFKLPAHEQILNIYNRGLNKYKSKYRQSGSKTYWGKQDLTIFLWIIDKYCRLNQKRAQEYTEQDWKYIASMIPFKSASDCSFKYFLIRKGSKEKNRWSKQQQQYLNLIIYQINGETIKWSNVSKMMYNKFPFTFRSPRNCRQRYNLLRMSQFNRSNKAWDKEQDMKLLQNFLKYGRKWKSISKELLGRSEYGVKNRYKVLMVRYGLNDKEQDKQKIMEMLVNRVKQQNEEREQENEDKQDKFEEDECNSKFEQILKMQNSQIFQKIEF